MKNENLEMALRDYVEGPLLEVMDVTEDELAELVDRMVESVNQVIVDHINE